MALDSPLRVLFNVQCSISEKGLAKSGLSLESRRHSDSGLLIQVGAVTYQWG